LNAILHKVPDDRQTLLLSATYPEKIQQIAQRILHKPEMIVVESNHGDASIEQQFYEIPDGEQRTEALRLLLLQHQPESALVFCATRKDVRTLTEKLRRFGFSVLSIHGELEQRERDQTLIQFSNGSAMVLVATDVAARGLDISALDVVVNYHLGRDVEDHVHRIGRTGRAGVAGVAWSFYHGRDLVKIEQIEEKFNRSISNNKLPPQSVLKQQAPRAPMVTGDILGALTSEEGVDSANVGKIKVVSNRSYVAVSRQVVKQALSKLASGKIKGRSYRARSL